MHTIIEDTWFPAGTRIRIGAGSDALRFVHCAFEGGEIEVEQTVDQAVFIRCTFRGTSFRGQPLSERIATGCRQLQPATEETAMISVPIRRCPR
jgi:hypothetical protein